MCYQFESVDVKLSTAQRVVYLSCMLLTAVSWSLLRAASHFSCVTNWHGAPHTWHMHTDKPHWNCYSLSLLFAALCSDCLILHHVVTFSNIQPRNLEILKKEWKLLQLWNKNMRYNCFLKNVGLIARNARTLFCTKELFWFHTVC